MTELPTRMANCSCNLSSGCSAAKFVDRSKHFHMLTLEVAAFMMTVNLLTARLISVSMFLAGNLRKSLLAVTIVSGLLSLFFAQRGVDAPPPTTIVTTETTSVTTTTIYVAPIRYVVQRGDTLYRIAETNRLDMKVLMEMNGITDPDRVEAGQELIFPPANGFIPVAPSTTMKP
jgi:LysM repeat protein